MRFMVTASAPISKEVLDMMKIAFACPVIEAYGLSETMGASNLTMTNDLFSVPKFIFNLQSCWTLLQEWSEIINVFLCKIRFLKYFLRRDHFWWNDFLWNDFLVERILLE